MEVIIALIYTNAPSNMYGTIKSQLKSNNQKSLVKVKMAYRDIEDNYKGKN